jgi:hypothetical protein
LVLDGVTTEAEVHERTEAFRLAAERALHAETGIDINLVFAMTRVRFEPGYAVVTGIVVGNQYRSTLNAYVNAGEAF